MEKEWKLEEKLNTMADAQQARGNKRTYLHPEISIPFTLHVWKLQQSSSHTGCNYEILVLEGGSHRRAESKK
jgi:hypothetical protein